MSNMTQISFKSLFLLLLLIILTSSGIMFAVFRGFTRTTEEYPMNINPESFLITPDLHNRNRISGDEYEVKLSLNDREYSCMIYVPPKTMWENQKTLPSLTILAEGADGRSAYDLYYKLPVGFLEKRDELQSYILIVPDTMDYGKEFDEVFFRYLRPYILRNFPLSPMPDAQVLAGIGNGGKMALRVIMTYETGYGGLGLFSADLSEEEIEDFNNWLHRHPNHISFIYADIGESDPLYDTYLELYSIMYGKNAYTVFISRPGYHVPAFFAEAYYRYFYVSGQYFKHLEQKSFIGAPLKKVSPLLDIRIPGREWY